MSAVASLAPEFRDRPLNVGDLVRLDILLETKAGADGEKWKIASPEGAPPPAWASFGSLTLKVEPIKILPSEGDTRKLEVVALVNQPGPIALERFELARENGEKIEVPAATLEGQVPAPQASEEDAKLPWILPPVAFGGWNYFVIALIAAVILASLGGAGWWAWRRWGRPLRRKLDHQEVALAALQRLQRYGRSKAGIQQEEWKLFSFELAAALRRYADTNFKIKSSDMTDREFLAALKETPKGPGQVGTLAKILETIDAVRYGRKDLNTSVVGELLQESRRYVKDTFEPPEGKKA